VGFGKYALEKAQSVLSNSGASGESGGGRSSLGVACIGEDIWVVGVSVFEKKGGVHLEGGG